MNGEGRILDVWVVKACCIPIFVSKVKKPEIFKDGGQMESNLMSLFRHNGVLAPYGIALQI